MRGSVPDVAQRLVALRQREIRRDDVILVTGILVPAGVTDDAAFGMPGKLSPGGSRFVISLISPGVSDSSG